MGGKGTKRIKSLLGKVRAVKTWQLFLVFVLLLFVCATLLRIDHVKMTELRSAVIEADESGNEFELADSLNKLKDFTTNNIVVNIIDNNGLKKIEFGTGVFYLEKSYARQATALLEAASDEEIDDSNPHGNIYADVSATCKGLALAYGWSWNTPAYIECWQEELAKFPESELEEGVIKVELPSTELFRREFSSPIWAPSAAGFVVLVTAILGVVIFIRFLIWCILEITLIIIKKS